MLLMFGDLFAHGPDTPLGIHIHHRSSITISQKPAKSDLCSHSPNPLLKSPQPQHVLHPPHPSHWRKRLYSLPLEGVQRVAKDTVKRVIITSSFVAVGTFGPDAFPGKVYTEDDWNPITLKQAEAAWTMGIKGPAYLASKTFAERAAWVYMSTREGELSWDLVVLNPPIVYGPLAHPISNLEDLGESAARIYKGFFADKMPEDGLVSDELSLYVDVRDLALAHVRAMEVVEAGDKRFNVCAGDVRSQEIADILKAEVPGTQERVPRGEPGKDTRSDDAARQDSSRAAEILGMSWRIKVDTFTSMGVQFLEMEKATLGV